MNSLRGRSLFLTTNWNAIQSNEAGNIIESYWGPIFHYLRRKGYNKSDAEDLTQGYFAHALEKKLFSKADPARGRFRSFLLYCIDKYIINIHRDLNAKKRCPPGGIFSLDAIAATESAHYEPADIETPVTVFNRVWATELIMRVLGILEAECRAKGKQDYFDAFRRCVMDPSLDGVMPPERGVLAQKYNITVKELSNRLTTTRRAYQRLLRVEIAKYTASEEEVDAEVMDLVRIHSGMSASILKGSG